MRVLLFTQWFPPEPQKLLFELALSLKEQGHSVTVLTGLPNYPIGKLYPGYKYRLWQKEEMDGLHVIRVPLYPDHSRNGFLRAINFISFSVASIILGPFIIPKVDIIHVIHPPITMGLAAWIISRIQKIPFTYEIQDMWPETLAATKMVQKQWILDLVGEFAKWVYDRAAGIRVISEGFRDNLISKGVPSNKIHVISNWVDPNFYTPKPKKKELELELGFTQKFVFTYAGTIGPAQEIHTLLNAAELIRDIPNILIAIFGEGIDREILTKEASRRGLDNIHFYGYISAPQMSEIYALSDVLLIHLKSDPLFKITIPHKTFVYMAVEKPILAAVEGDVEKIISEVGAGITCPPSQPELMADSMRKFYTTSTENLAQMGRRGRLAAETYYARENLTRKVSLLLQKIVDENTDRN